MVSAVVVIVVIDVLADAVLVGVVGKVAVVDPVAVAGAIVVVVDSMIVEVIVELITLVDNVAAVPDVTIKISFVWNISV
jgi:hypothetical protein